MKSLITIACTVAVLLSLFSAHAAEPRDLDSTHYRVSAELTDSKDMSGVARFDEFEHDGMTERRLYVEVMHAPPGQKLSVLLNGRTIGEIKTDKFGRGSFSRWAATEGDPDRSGVPFVKKGNIIAVGDAKGVFVGD